MEPRREPDELAVAVAVAVAGKAGEGTGHGVDVLGEVEHRAVVEERAPLRVEPHQVELLVELAAGLAENAPQHPRHGEDGGPHVEAEARLLEHRGLAAEPRVLLEEHHGVAARRQRAGRRQAAEAAADHAYPGAVRRRLDVHGFSSWTVRRASRRPLAIIR